MTLAEFQKILKQNKIDAYLVSRNNMFLGQDILPEENKIMELTGFTGSAGNLIVFQDQAVLFVDGRYEIQSKLETNPEEVTVECTKAASFYNWLLQNYPSDGKKLKLYYDAWSLSAKEYNFLSSRLSGVKLIEDKKQLLGARVSAKSGNIFDWSIEYAGISSEEKISKILQLMNKQNLQGMLITAADSVSWLLNRRSDILPVSPVFRAYLLINKQGVECFADFGNKALKTEIKLQKALKTYKNRSLGLCLGQTPQKIISFLNKNAYTDIPDPVAVDKAVKNPVELKGMAEAHKRDAVAMVEFLSWFENNRKGLSELDIVEKLRSFREQQPLFFSDSFETIAGFGPNGAIVHYQPTPESNLPLSEGSLLLLDSGAQYYDGTTDITRTLAIGSPTPQMTEDFTTVLKSHIALASALFPEKTEGTALDAVCRGELWRQGKNYNHGTGHGVGCFLNVHEGPHSLSPKAPPQALKAGMITSIEPGYYKENAYGIRIENLYFTAPANEKQFEIPMLKFCPLTLVPIDKRLINKYLLNEREINWLNAYHQTVFDELKNKVGKDTLIWLKEACSPL